MKKSILFIDHDSIFTGSSISLTYLIKSFKHAGYIVYVLTSKSEFYSERFRSIGAKTIKISSGLLLHLHASVDLYPFSVRKALSFFFIPLKIIIIQFIGLFVLLKYKPMVVYINEYVFIHFSIICKLLGIPVITHVRSQFLKGKFGIRNYLLRKFLVAFSNYIFTITKTEAAQIQSNSSKIITVYEFLDENDFNKIDNSRSKEKFILDQNKRIILMTGGVLPIKGCFEFIKSIVFLLRKRTDVLYIITNVESFSTEYAEKCKAFVLQNNLEKYVRFLGHIENIKELISASDILVSSSITSHFSRPVIEAWANNTAIVSSDTQHAKEFIEDGIDGLLYDKFNSAELAEKIDLLLSDKELYRSISDAGLRKAKEFYNVSNVKKIIEYCNNFYAR